MHDSTLFFVTSRQLTQAQTYIVASQTQTQIQSHTHLLRIERDSCAANSAPVDSSHDATLLDCVFSLDESRLLWSTLRLCSLELLGCLLIKGLCISLYIHNIDVCLCACVCMCVCVCARARAHAHTFGRERERGRFDGVKFTILKFTPCGCVLEREEELMRVLGRLVLIACVNSDEHVCVRERREKKRSEQCEREKDRASRRESAQKRARE